jgi:murein DD-endopeptidase MepM/ murein hydrolase activator NlpD
MLRIRRFLRKAFTPITIMVVPHSKSRLLRVKIPLAALLALVVLWGFGTFYVVSIGVQTADYREMSKKLSYFSSQFLEMRSTVASLQKAEDEFTRLFSLKSKKKVLEAVSSDDTGALDIDLLRKQVAQAMASVSEIRRYVDEERDIYYATPVGWPVPGALSSGFGKREHPRTGEAAFHSGVDIRAASGTPVKATADGIVSVSGWVAGNGNTVVIEHGRGFSTAYAHNKQNLVKVGQKVKRGDTIALSGATGVTTGPHLHYEVWKQSRQVNPISFLEERS